MRKGDIDQVIAPELHLLDGEVMVEEDIAVGTDMEVDTRIAMVVEEEGVEEEEEAGEAGEEVKHLIIDIP